MSSNVGLSTPRGSGTSGYVQRNLSALKPRQTHRAEPYSKENLDALKHRQRQPDAEIREHDRRREVEVKVFELRDRLEDEGVDEDEIDERADKLRKELLAEQERSGAGAAGKTGKEARRLKGHQVHELAAAKIEESEKMRRALGISKDYQEGSHWERQREKELQKEQASKEEESSDREDD